MESNPQQNCLQDQVAVVTGGGRGIGRAIAQILAAAGARVAVVARTGTELAETVRLIEQAGGKAQAFSADVTVPAEVQGAMGAVAVALGPVDVLVNNAAAVTLRIDKLPSAVGNAALASILADARRAAERKGKQ